MYGDSGCLRADRGAELLQEVQACREPLVLRHCQQHFVVHLRQGLLPLAHLPFW